MQPADAAPLVVLGAGLTGLSTALHAARAGANPVTVLERRDDVGGKARSRRRDGYTFDITGHWLHLRDARTQDLVQSLFPTGDLVEIERCTGIYTHGVMLPYPFQANLHGLPLPIVQECLATFVEAQVAAAAPDAKPPRTFEEFAVGRFGRGIAEHFFIPYNQKLWGSHYDSLTPDWISRFVPLPDVRQIVGGAIGVRQDGLGYNARFSYPAAGGIDGLAKALAGATTQAGATLQRGAEVTRIDTEARVLTLADGTTQPYGKLVSTLPLPELVRRLSTVPAAVAEAASKLRWVRWRYLDVGTKSPVPMKEHWVYVPEPSVPFFRVGCYSNALPAMAPEGCGALYVELGDRDGQPDLPAIFEGLTAMGALASPDDVAFADLHDIEYAYVVFDEAYDEARRVIFEHLERVGVHSCGRYGAWIYNSMEDSILAGMEAAAWLTA
ncbi:MAG: FAD-dependent oxidoreductase [Myxococcota bacterium]